jgi:cytochrome c553
MRKAWALLENAMSSHVKCLLFLALGIPVLASAVSPARQEFLEVLAAQPNEAHGRELFERCTRCHGPVANGTSEGAIPRIAGQHFQVLARQIINFRYAERWNTRMEDVTMDLHVLENAQDIADVSLYVSRIERGGPRGVGDGTMVARGAALYASRCASCHGAAGEGDGPAWVPRVAGQHAGYLVRQIYDSVAGRRPPMAREHRKSFDKLDFDDVQGLADYLARSGWDQPTDR